MKIGVFTQMYVQLVFAVYKRENILIKTIRPVIFEYMGGILRDMKHKTIIINGVSDHVHVFFGLNPAVSISDTVHDLKRGSSLFINENKLLPHTFCWQQGYGAFTYSRSQIENVYNYIKNQEIHHARKTFRKEYLGYLKENEVDFDEKFLFEFYDDISITSTR